MDLFDMMNCGEKGIDGFRMDVISMISRISPSRTERSKTDLWQLPPYVCNVRVST